MRSGPSTKVLAGYVGIGPRVDVTLGKRTLGLDLPVDNVVLAATVEREVSHQLTYTLPASFVPAVGDWQAPAAGYGQRAHLEAVVVIDGGIQHLIDMGWYLHNNEWEEQEDGTVTVTAHDLMVLNQEQQAKWPSSPPKGQRLSREFQRMSPGLPTLLDEGVADVVMDETIQWDRDYSKALLDMAEAYGFLRVVGPDQVLHARPLRDGRYLDAIYRAKTGLLSAQRKGEGRKPNHLVVVGEIAGNKEATGEKAASAVLAKTDKKRTASGVSVWFYVSTSKKEQLGGTWTSTVPTDVAGKFVWARTRTTFTTGNPVDSNPVMVFDATEKPVRSMKVEFYRSDSDKDQRGGAWQDTAPAFASGKHIFSRVTVSFDNKQTVRYTAESLTMDPPFNPDYGTVTEIIEVESSPSQASVNAALARRQRELAVSSQRRTVTIALDPRIELGDVVGVYVEHDDGEVEPLVLRVVAYEMRLSEPGAPMRVDGEVLAW